METYFVTDLSASTEGKVDTNASRHGEDEGKYDIVHGGQMDNLNHFPLKSTKSIQKIQIHFVQIQNIYLSSKQIET